MQRSVEMSFHVRAALKAGCFLIPSVWKQTEAIMFLGEDTVCFKIFRMPQVKSFPSGTLLTIHCVIVREICLFWSYCSLCPLCHTDNEFVLYLNYGGLSPHLLALSSHGEKKPSSNSSVQELGVFSCYIWRAHFPCSYRVGAKLRNDLLRKHCRCHYKVIC